MNITERIFKIDQLLNQRESMTTEELTNRLGIHKSTLKRDVSFMKDNYNAPIIFDRFLGGYRFDKKKTGKPYELPGLWFSAEEIHALMTMQHLLEGIDSGGLIGPHIKPLVSRLNAILGLKNDTSEDLKKRIRVEVIGNRAFDLDFFQIAGTALLKRNRLNINYFSRSKNKSSEREISPQRMVYYKGNWYLDAWCHENKEIRTFALDCIKKAELLDKKATNITDRNLDKVLASGYGIFSGKKIEWVTLKFSAERAKWVATERWHPKQEGQFLDDGSYLLKFPYSKDTELIMDIMKYGSDVRVEEPKYLRDKIHKILIDAVRNY